MDYCHCWGDTHCSHVPFDSDNKKVTDDVKKHFYQYHHNCASTLAKSAPENTGGVGSRWEVQFSQMGPSNTAAASAWGVAVKVGSVIMEKWKWAANGKQNWNQAKGTLWVNGE